MDTKKKGEGEWQGSGTGLIVEPPVSESDDEAKAKDGVEASSYCLHVQWWSSYIYGKTLSNSNRDSLIWNVALRMWRFVFKRQSINSRQRCGSAQGLGILFLDSTPGTRQMLDQVNWGWIYNPKMRSHDELAQKCFYI